MKPKHIWRGMSYEFKEFYLKSLNLDITLKDKEWYDLPLEVREALIKEMRKEWR